MYGRGNIFSNTSGNSASGSYGNNYNNNYSGNNSSGSNRIGSQRLDYRFEEPASYLTNIIFQWKDQPPSSIVTREETLHLTTAELRIEDYHCMRKQQIRASLQNKLKDAIRTDAFNPQILNFQFDRLPPVSHERPLDIDTIRSGRLANRNPSGNIFSSSSQNNTGANIFSSRNSSSGGNIFSNNNSGGYNSSGSYSSNNNRGSNIFGSSSGNSYGNNSGGNIFSRSSNTGNNNVFSSGNGGGNIFSNSNTGGSNIFSSNRSSNIFGNNGQSNNNVFNNNNPGGNIFSNSRNSNSIFNNGNSLFNNPQNNGMNMEMLNGLRALFQENQNFMMMMAQQMSSHPKPKDEEHFQEKSPFDSLLQSQPLPKADSFYNERRRSPEVIIIKPKDTTLSSKVSNLQPGSILGRSTNGRGKGSTRLHLKGTQSIIAANRSSLRQGPQIPELEGQNQFDLCLKVAWIDDIYHEMPSEHIQERVKIIIDKTGQSEWTKQLLMGLKAVVPWIRSDADIEIESFKRDPHNQCTAIRGSLRQKMVNLPESYRISYSKIKNEEIYNLAISNAEGTISWERPIAVKKLEFQHPEEEPFLIGNNNFSCAVQALNSRCRVTFYSLPEQISKDFHQNPSLARRQFAEYVKKQSQGAFALQDMWARESEGGWSMIVSSFPRIPKEPNLQA